MAGQLISHSIGSDVSIHWTYLGWRASLLPLRIIGFLVFDGTTSYGHSKCVNEMKAFECTNH
jgi:hypothetical protein